MDFEFGQCLHNLHRFETDGDDLQEQVEGIPLVAHLDRVVVEVVHDSGSFVDADAGALHHPVERGLLVDDILLRLKRNVLHGDPVVVDQRGLVFGRIARCRSAWSCLWPHCRSSP